MWILQRLLHLVIFPDQPVPFPVPCLQSHSLFLYEPTLLTVTWKAALFWVWVPRLHVSKAFQGFLGTNPLDLHTLYSPFSLSFIFLYSSFNCLAWFTSVWLFYYSLILPKPKQRLHNGRQFALSTAICSGPSLRCWMMPFSSFPSLVRLLSLLTVSSVGILSLTFTFCQKGKETDTGSFHQLFPLPNSCKSWT